MKGRREQSRLDIEVSRTIADLEDFDEIKSAHVAEAVHYRPLDRTYWT